jgi:hypothetical protein
VVESGGLENRCVGNPCTEGSNPSPSAHYPCFSLSRYAGIQVWHRTGCPSEQGKYCNCKPSYRAEVWSPRDEKEVRKTFSSLGEAKAWRSARSGAERYARRR